MNPKTIEAIHAAHQAVELAASAVQQLHNAAVEDTGPDCRLLNIILEPMLGKMHTMDLTLARIALDVCPEE